MTRIGLSVLVLVVVGVVGRAGDNKRIEEAERLIGELKAALQGIKDAAGAKAALPKLERLNKQLDGLGLDKRRPGKKDEARLAKAAGKLNKEVRRLDVDLKMPKALHDLPLFRQTRKAQEQYARASANALSAQVEIYKLNNGDYPGKISALAERQPNGGAPLVPPDAVRDPWGREYQIDPAGTRNRGKRADVFSLGHLIEKKMIGNWPPPKGAKEKGTKKGGS
jgi:hypothetical protein